MVERRNVARRAVCDAIVIASLAGVLLFGMELLWIETWARPSLLIAGGVVRFGPALLGLFFGAAVIVGLLEGLVIVIVNQTAGFLARRRRSRANWTAILYTAVSIPAVAWLVARVFSGRRARTIPFHHLVVTAVGVIAMVGIFLGFRSLLTLGRKLKVHIWRSEDGRLVWTAAFYAAMLLGAALSGYFADQRLLKHRYVEIHIALELLTFGALELAVWAIALFVSVGKRRWGILAAPRAALALILVGLSSLAFSLAAFHSRTASTLRQVSHEHGAVSAHLLDLAQDLGLGIQPTASEQTFALAGAVPLAFRPGAPRLPGADIVLITVDALRADHLGAYGYGRPTSPDIDALARESVVFQRAYTPVPHTSFAIASLHIGKYAHSLSELGLFAGHETLAGILRRYGYKTAAFFPPAVFYVDGERFKSYEETRYSFEYVRFEPFLEDVDAVARTNQVIDFLESEEPGRVFLWIHYFGPHEPYVAHPEVGAPLAFGSSERDRYDGEIYWVDREVGRLVAYLRKARPGAILALTADHGEEFGEHGGAYHGTTLFDEQIRVPLIVHVPGTKPKRILGPVSTIDLVPTLLSLVDRPISARLRGTDLTPWMGTEMPEREENLPPVFAEVDSQKMVALGQEKLICEMLRGYCQLFDLDRDPGERQDMSANHRERTEELRRRIIGWMTTHSEYERAGQARVGEEDVLERGLLGDARAVPRLLEIARDGKVAPRERLTALRALARMPQALANQNPEALGSGVVREPLEESWATVVMAWFGDDAALSALAERAPELEALDFELAARAAMARVHHGDKNAIMLLIGLLEHGEDTDLLREVIMELGKSGDRRVKGSLIASYEHVRMRRHAALALGDLKDGSTIDFLVERLADEPYSSVRAAVAHSLGQLGSSHALSQVTTAFAKEEELTVVSGLAWALSRLGAATAISRPTWVDLPGDAIEVWLVIQPGFSGKISLSVATKEAKQENITIDVLPGRDAHLAALPPGARRVLVTPPVTHLLSRPARSRPVP